MWEAQVIVAHMLFLGYKCKYFFEIFDYGRKFDNHI